MNKLLYSTAAKVGQPCKNTPQAVDDGSWEGKTSLDYEIEWCPAGIIERFEKIKMASKMATPKKSGP